MADVQQDPATRAEIRAFVRANHPDVGGDPEAFAAGLARLRARSGDGSRFDAPVVVEVRPRGVRGVLHRVRCRWRRRHAPPRVR
ncbi:hypothetical protein EIL87_18820 [Saccharopolyspora rhizosphaerae]|uniref:Uncharacterized protein n=1 Tax=Saccharopolyspora rhizosphaerae TaxID=2492662 RepID=A0A426JP23_9PSEU|nr:hypothetical protein [Saccharopolyspora rhizosphaerae]RRO14787.1 hypothetical protein EIL87_18820 [Saccharopolyspora rhizosphaerae]